MLASTLRRFANCDTANLSMIFALSMIPLVFLVGMGVDYTSAAYRQEQLNAFADSAALAAVTPTMMGEGDAQSVAAAQNTFNAQATKVNGINYNAGSGVNVTITDSLTTRTVTVAYQAASQNAFPNVLGVDTIALSGTSQAVGSLAPNINFYLLLDDSPSMAIASSPGGITTMQQNTPKQENGNGCAFACHETHPSGENPALGNPGGEDNYTLARNLGVTLRIDLLRQATQNLMTTAQTTEVTNHAAYQAAIYTFDVTTNTIHTLTSDLATDGTAAAAINVLTVYDNNYLTSTNHNNDTDTNYDNAMNTLNGIMPNPGNGTNAKGDTPQEVLFFVTDGVEDESNGGRVQSIMDPAKCATIKARGIRIAVLYTTYLPIPSNAWYNQWIAPFQSNIAPALETCASPGLYFEVQSGGDISGALNALFQKAVETSRLTE
jgi:Flp pilus assembly protein TadG